MEKKMLEYIPDMRLTISYEWGARSTRTLPIDVEKKNETEFCIQFFDNSFLIEYNVLVESTTEIFFVVSVFQCWYSNLIEYY